MAGSSGAGAPAKGTADFLGYSAQNGRFALGRAITFAELSLTNVPDLHALRSEGYK